MAKSNIFNIVEILFKKVYSTASLPGGLSTLARWLQDNFKLFEIKQTFYKKLKIKI